MTTRDGQMNRRARDDWAEIAVVCGLVLLGLGQLALHPIRTLRVMRGGCWYG